MAVSGRIIPIFNDSMSLGSTVDFDCSCDPCLKDGQQVEASKFCVECKENLCKTCIRFHLRNKASKHHKMVDRDNIGRKAVTLTTSNICSEKCSTHTNELIKFFCPKHQALCCNDCVIIDHRNCEIDYIPDKCSDRSAKKEFKSIMKKLSLKQAEFDDIVKKATVRDKNIDICFEKAIQDMTDFQEKINKRIDQLKKQVQADAKDRKSKEKQEVQEVTNTCTRLSSDMHKYQTRLQHLKASHQDADLFIAVKQAKLTLESEEITEAEDVLQVSEMESVFKCSVDLDAFLSRKSIFGKMITVLPTKKKALIFSSLKESSTDISEMPLHMSGITGCAVLSSDKLVLANESTNKVVIVHTQEELKLDEKKLDSSPFDIAVLPDDQIAVSMPKKKEILIIETRSKSSTTWNVLRALVGNLSVINRIEVKRQCKGISYHQGHLYVVCNDPNSVLIMDAQGDVEDIITLSTITLSKEIFKAPKYIVFNEVLGCVCISDSQSNCVVNVTLQGNVSAVYRHQDLDSPEGILMIHDGSLLVCNSNWNSSFFHISEDLKQGQKILIDTKGSIPQCICYNQDLDEIYAVCELCHVLFILQPKWQTN